MNLSEFAFKIIFLFVPGLIAFNIVNKLTFHKEFKTSDVLLGSLTYGFICYLVYYSVFVLIPNVFPYFPRQEFYFAESLTNSQAKLNFQEITIATLLAVPIGFISSALVNSRLLFKFARKLGISDKIDDIGVWNEALEFSLNQWIIIRDIQNDLMYRGWIKSFSDGSDSHEVLLRNVDVYRNSDAAFFYTIPALYISLSGEDNIRIEFQSWRDSECVDNNDTDYPLDCKEEEN